MFKEHFEDPCQRTDEIISAIIYAFRTAASAQFILFDRIRELGIWQDMKESVKTGISDIYEACFF